MHIHIGSASHNKVQSYSSF